MREKKMDKKKAKPIKIFIIALLVLVILIVLFVASFIAYLTITEYRPVDVEDITDYRTTDKKVERGKELSIMTWNIGYGSLGDNADFFMDGGSHTFTATKERTELNLYGIKSELQAKNPDFIFLQEVDYDSLRSNNVNEIEYFANAFLDRAYAFAHNYKCEFVPIPVPPMGKVMSGIMTISDYDIEEATRISLPVPFKWPIRVANLKRGMLVTRIPIEGSDKELVLVNFHLEAYDSGEGKIEQTKKLRVLIDFEVAKGNYVIVGGDFNQTIDTVDLEKYKVTEEGHWEPGIIDGQALIDAGYQIVMDDSTPTCRSLKTPLAGYDKDDFQYYLIDGFIVSNNIKINSYETVQKDFVYSDHNPVYLSFTIE